MTFFLPYIYIYIYIYKQGDPKKKTEPIYFWLKFLNLILAFSFFQDMK